MIRSHFGVLALAATVVLTGCGEDKKAQSARPSQSRSAARRR